MSELNKLVVVPPNERTQLRDLYRRDWPKNVSGYYVLKHHIQCCEKDPDNEKFAKVYCLNGEWNDGLFIFSVRNIK